MRRVSPVSGQVYLSVREAAIRTSVAPRTVKRWISAGILPATRLPSPKGLGQLRIKLQDFEVMMARGAHSHEGDLACFVLVFLKSWEDITS
jgi:excisionase family DNA binding protein